MNILYEGTVYVQGQGLGGWARRADSPEPLWLEVLVDDCVLGVGRADLPEPEACGFWLPLPPVALEEGGTARVRVANTTVCIGEPVALPEGKPTVALRGELHGDAGLTLSGWAQDALEPEKKVVLTAWLHDEEISRTVAGGRRYRPEHGDGHGFTLHLPAALADGAEHVVEVRDVDDRPLPGSPVAVRVLPEGPAQWLERQKRLDAPQKDLLRGLLRQLETRVPRAQGCVDYAAWKAAFPAPQISLKGVCSVGVLTDGPVPTASLRKQRGLDCRWIAGPGGDATLLLQNGESLHPCAVAHLASVMRETGAGLVYADGETRDADGNLTPLFRPSWDDDAFLGQDYLGPCLVSRIVLDAAPPVPGEAHAATRARLALAASTLGGIRHLPQILSTSLPIGDGTARRTVLQEWLDARCPGATAEPLARTDLFQMRYALTAAPRVSVIIPTRDHADLLRRCLESLRTTAYPNMEILVVDNDSTAPDALDLLEAASRQPRTRVLRRPGVFNYAAINNDAAREAAGECLCFLNNDAEATSPHWLGEMVALLLAAQGGCVGAKLLWPNGLVQHGGVIVGTHQLAAHVGNQWLGDDDGFMNRNRLVHQYSAVTAACLLTPRSLFLDLGGFDAVCFPVAFNDVDYCLRVRAAGKKVLWTPFAELLHHESASRGKDSSPMNKARAAREMRLFRARWGEYDDPFYNPNLPLSTVLEPFAGLALPPRARRFR